LNQVDFRGKVDESLRTYLNDEYLPHILAMMTLELRKMDADQLVDNNENLQARLRKLSEFSVVNESNLH